MVQVYIIAALYDYVIKLISNARSQSGGASHH